MMPDRPFYLWAIDLLRADNRQSTVRRSRQQISIMPDGRRKAQKAQKIPRRLGSVLRLLRLFAAKNYWAMRGETAEQQCGLSRDGL